MGHEVVETETTDVKTDYFSDNSASLPGISGSGGPIGFEPGMFNKQDLSKVTYERSTLSNKWCQEYLRIPIAQPLLKESGHTFLIIRNL